MSFTPVSTPGGKTRVQVDALPALTVFRSLMREEGVRALSKGMLARISWIAPSCAIGIVCYEQAKLVFAADKH